MATRVKKYTVLYESKNKNIRYIVVAKVKKYTIHYDNKSNKM